MMKTGAVGVPPFPCLCTTLKDVPAYSTAAQMECTLLMYRKMVGKLDFCGILYSCMQSTLLMYVQSCYPSCCSVRVCVLHKLLPELEKDGVDVLELHACLDYNVVHALSL